MDVRGIVQGVGFRPYVYRLARQLGLTGSVHNTDAGVSIEVQGAREDVAAFIEVLSAQAPPVASVFQVETNELDVREETEFVILESTRSAAATTLISPDIATCDDCLRELFDPGDRRYRYPFINCTNCGPRFTIVRSVPYDRAQTSMAGFAMCVRCRAEYDDPLDRRFHAQPNACWDCGPRVELPGKQGEPIADAVRLLTQGCIVAVKGLGGFHLAVDALQPEAVGELRRRKHRAEKPFAVMVPDLAAAELLCFVSEDEAALLRSPQRPIVLLRRRSGALDALAPDGNELGIFLPYTPMHHLLFAYDGPKALVMTSGNLSEEPIAIDNDEAVARLGGIADYFMLHDRDILLRCDDSVVRRMTRGPQFARRSRGYVPAPILLRDAVPPILAVGGELKNAICISRGRYAFPGQHIGDLENLSAYEFFQESVAHFSQILQVTPRTIAYDQHPGYLATRWAKSQTGVRLVGVQHHHAHIASCMAENQLDGPVIGVALDGTGYGTDGHAWGGEVLIADLTGFERAAHLAYVPMPGGAQAIHEPWRMAVAGLWQAFGEEWRSHAPAAWVAGLPRGVAVVEQLLRNGAHAPLSSSCGRLFDAVAALVCDRMTVSYEAQAAIALEACCDPDAAAGAYPFTIRDGGCMEIDAAAMFVALTDDLRRGVARGILSRRFHNGLVDALSDAVDGVAQRSGLTRVCLSGGSFQNAVLSGGLETALARRGLTVFTHALVPAGDGGLSLGQLAIAASRKS